MNIELEHAAMALDGVSRNMSKLPKEVQREVLLALSLIHTHGITSEEFKAELGARWAICRATPANLERYGNCVSATRYTEAERDAIRKRGDRLIGLSESADGLLKNIPAKPKDSL